MGGGHERDEERSGGNRSGLQWVDGLIAALAFGGVGGLTGLWGSVLMACI